MTKEKLLKSLITKVADKSANSVCGFILYSLYQHTPMTGKIIFLILKVWKQVDTSFIM